MKSSDKDLGFYFTKLYQIGWEETYSETCCDKTMLSTSQSVSALGSCYI